MSVTLLLASLVGGATALPNYHGCVTAHAKTFKYCDLSLSNEDRVDSLLAELTLEEKVGIISPDPGLGESLWRT